MAETDLLITQDGTTFVLGPTKMKHVLSEEGTGMPPIEYITQRGPFQDGETVRDYFLRPRVVQFHYRQKFCSRMDYWRGRQALLSILAPNRTPTETRGNPQTIWRKVLGDGTIYDLRVVVQQGPVFQARNPRLWDEWAIDEIIRVIAYDPVYYGQNLKTIQFFPYPGFPYTFPFDLIDDSIQFIFPITFPIQFNTFDHIIPIDYKGTWLTYPQIRFTGPFDYFKIDNLTTGEVLHFTQHFEFGEVLYIDLSFGNKVAYKVSDPATSLVGFFTSYSDLATFHFKPSTINQIRVVAGAVGTPTNIEIMYYERFIGI